jgi:DNA-binding response OmpR family regulator
MLPKMDGYKVCGLLKADTRYNKVPILIFTARAQESDKQMGQQVGADAYVVKPFDSQALLAKIKELLKE